MSLSPVEIGSLLANAATVASVVVAFLKLRSDQQKSRREIELSKKYLKSLSELVQAHTRSQDSQQELEIERLNWQKLTDLGKALWAVATYEEE